MDNQLEALIADYRRRIMRNSSELGTVVVGSLGLQEILFALERAQLERDSAQLSREQQTKVSEGLKEQLIAAQKKLNELVAKLDAGNYEPARHPQYELPPFTEELEQILGRPNFRCNQIAEILRKSGQDIRRKSECEQAAVIYWMLGLYIEHGSSWWDIARDQLQTIYEAAQNG